MNKNGFTLIELVSVVAILSIIGVLMLPKINTAFKESRADQLEEVREKVVKATDVYLKYSCGKDSYNLLMKNDEVKIGLNVISDCCLLDSRIYNPVSGKYFDIDNEYVIAKIDEVGMIDYELSF